MSVAEDVTRGRGKKPPPPRVTLPLTRARARLSVLQSRCITIPPEGLRAAMRRKLALRKAKAALAFDREFRLPAPAQLTLAISLHPPMPRTRAECKDGPRPCPWVRCKFNLYLDADESKDGKIKLNFPGTFPWDMPPTASCALDVVDEEGGEELALEEVGMRVNLTRERVRQIELAFRKLMMPHVDPDYREDDDE